MVEDIVTTLISMHNNSICSVSHIIYKGIKGISEVISWIVWYYNSEYGTTRLKISNLPVRRKFLAGGNIDEFDEFPAIRQYFPYQFS